MNHLGIALITLALTGIVSCSSGLSDGEHVANARRYVAAENLDAATIELKNALQKNGSSAEARHLLGTVYIRLGQAGSAEKELQHALALGHPAGAVLPTLAIALLQQEKFEDIGQLQIPEDMTATARADFMVSLGLAKLYGGFPGSAQPLIEGALELAPSSRYAAEGNARLLAARGELEESRKVLRAIVRVDPSYAVAWSLLAELENASGNTEAATEATLKAIALNNTSVDDRLRLVMLQISTGEVDEADKQINFLEKFAAKQPQVLLARGMLFFERQDFSAAGAVFTELIGMTTDFQPALLYGGATQLELGHYDVADQLLVRFLSLQPNHAAANQMLATIRMREGDFEAAEELLTLTLEENLNNALALSTLAQATLLQGNTEVGIEVLRELTSLEPTSAPARIALASALATSDRRDEAVAELQIAIELEPVQAAATAKLSRLYLAWGDNDKALQAVQNHLGANESSIDGLNLLGSVQLSRGEHLLASQSFEAVLAQQPENFSAHGGLAALALGFGNGNIARTHFQAMLQTHPADLRVLLDLAALELSENNHEAAKLALQQAIDGNPNQLEPRLKLGTAYHLQGRPVDAKQILGDMPQRYPNHQGLRVLQAEVARQTRHWDEAIMHYQYLIKLAPRDAGYRRNLGRCYGEMGNDGEQRAILEDLLGWAPTYDTARLDLAKVLFLQGDVKAAKKQIQVLRERQFSRTDLILLQGQIAERAGDTESAMAAYREAFRQQPSNINLLRLINKQWQQGDTELALSELQKWLKQHPEDLLTKVELGNRYMSVGKNQQAIALFEEVVGTSGEHKSPAALNNLGRLLSDSDPERALTYATQALNLVPDSPLIMDTVTRLLLTGDEDDLKRAQHLNREALAQLPANPTLLLRKAQLAFIDGDRPRAQTTLEALLRDHENFPERQQALEALAVLQQ